MNALILDGATGERMKPITNWIPKDLIRIDGISLLQRHLDPLQEMDEVRCIAVTIHQHEDKVLNAIGLIDKGERKIRCQIEHKLQGTAKAVLDAWKILGKDESLLVVYGDVFFDNPLRLFKWMARIQTDSGASVSALGYGPLKQYRSGIMWIDALNKVETFREGTPTQGKCVSHAGLLILSPQIYPLLEMVGRENKSKKFHLGEHFFPIAVEKTDFYGYDIGRHQDIGTIEQYCDLQERIYNKKLGIEEVTDLTKVFKTLLEVNGTIYLIGNGGSLTVAQHTALDLIKAAGKKALHLQDPPTISAYANDFTFDDSIVEYFKLFITPKDVLIGFSASGESPNVLNAIAYCNEKGITTIGITSKGSTLAKISKIAISFDQKDPKILEDLFAITSHKIVKLLEDVK